MREELKINYTQMKNKILICICSALLVFVSLNSSMAQNNEPEKGDKIVSLRLGRSIDLGDISFSEINQTTDDRQYTYIRYPYSITSDNNNSIVNAIGLELKYFITNTLALRFAGSGTINISPSRDFVMGVKDPNGENYPGTTIPSFLHKEGKTTKQFNIDVGVDKYYTTKIKNLFVFAGIQFNYIYGQMEIYDGFRGLDSNGEVIPTYDTRRGETYGFGGSCVGGIDYYIAEGFFLGIEIRTVSYMYNVKRIFHQQGMEAQDASSRNMSFLNQPVIKLGFKF